MEVRGGGFGRLLLQMLAGSVELPGHDAMAESSSVRWGVQLVVPDHVLVLELHSICCRHNCDGELKGMLMESFPNA